MKREDMLKKIFAFLPLFINSVGVFVIFVALSVVFSLIVFLKAFKVDTSFAPVKQEKNKIVEKSYEGISKFFSTETDVISSPSGNEVQPSVFTISGKVLGTIIAGKDKFLIVSQKGSFNILKEGDTLNGEKIVEITSLYYRLADGKKIYIISPGGVEPVNQKFQQFPVEKKAKEKVVRLDKTMVEKETADIGKLLKDVNIVPVLRHGETIGYRFLTIRPGTILTKIGFRNGDIVTSVNDMPVRTVEDAFKIYNMLRNEDTVKVEIERRGKKEVIIYEIR